MKKAIAILLPFLLVIGLSACGTANMNHETVDTGTGSQQTDHTGISFLKKDMNAKADIEIIPQRYVQGDDLAEDYSLSGIGFIDSLTALGETFPVYVDPYPTGEEGPLYEITDALKDTLANNLTRYLGCLYEDFDSQNAEFSSDSDRPYDVYYTKDGINVHSYANRIAISSSDYAHVKDVSDTALLDHTLVKAAVSYLGLIDPVMSTTVVYAKDGTEYQWIYKITDKASDTMQHIHNINFAYLTVKQFASSDNISISIQNPIELTKHADAPVLSYSFVLAELAKLYPNMDTKDVKAEIYYSRSAKTGYYVPCYRFYIRGSDSSASGSDIRYGMVDVALIDRSEGNQ